MAIPENKKRLLARKFHRYFRETRGTELPMPFGVSHIFAAANQIDTVLDASLAQVLAAPAADSTKSIEWHFNQALPEPFKTTATVADKSWLFMAVVAIRHSTEHRK